MRLSQVEAVSGLTALGPYLRGTGAVSSRHLDRHIIQTSDRQLTHVSALSTGPHASMATWLSQVESASSRPLGPLAQSTATGKPAANVGNHESDPPPDTELSTGPHVSMTMRLSQVETASSRHLGRIINGTCVHRYGSFHWTTHLSDDEAVPGRVRTIRATVGP